jgi:hypothetical protein
MSTLNQKSDTGRITGPLYDPAINLYMCRNNTTTSKSENKIKRKKYKNTTKKNVHKST